MNRGVSLFAVELTIDDRRYGFNVPARSWEHAQQLIASTGGQVVGSDVLEIPAIGARAVMSFVDRICLAPVSWPGNAEEQLSTFLAIGGEPQPNQIDETGLDDL